MNLQKFLLAGITTWLLSQAFVRAESNTSPHPSWSNLAQGKTVTFSREAGDPDVSDPDDLKQLVDGECTNVNPMWYDKQDRLPVGWNGTEAIEIKVDLGQVEAIRGVALRAAAGQSGVAWPQSVKVYVSDDGETFAPVGDLMKSTPVLPSSGYEALWLRDDKLKTHGRYVKLVVSPTDSGAGIYFYADELEIYSGDAAWKSLPLPAPEKPVNASSPRPQWQNVAGGAVVSLDSPPTDASVSDEDDEKQLTDATLSTSVPIWSDKRTVGWMGGKVVEFTVDLGAVQPIRGVALHLAAGQAGVEWPASIDVYVSDTGDQFTPVGDVVQSLAEPLPDSGYAAVWAVSDKLETHGRYVKFVISPSNLGNGSYVFLDEVEIYRGEDAWLSRPLTGVDAPEQWAASWAELAWKENLGVVPEAERSKPILFIDGKNESGANTITQKFEATGEGVRFSLQGEAGKPRSMSWSAKLAKPVSTKNCPYAVLTFKAQGIRRAYDLRPLVMLQGIANEGSGNEVILLDSNTPLNDGLTHTILQKLPAGFNLQQVKVSVLTEDDSAFLTLEKLEFVKDVPAIFTSEISIAQGNWPEGFQSIDLAPLANGSIATWFKDLFARYGAAMDGGSDLPSGMVTVSGAPFKIGPSSKNLMMMPETKPSDERVTFLGQTVDKRYLDPISRHDVLSIDVDAKAREVFLLLATSSPLVQIRGGIPKTALRLDDQESLMVELSYEQGESELAFPYSIADKSCFIPGREMAAFAVSADPNRRLRKVTLHNRHFGPAFAVAGLTLNTSAKPLVPALDTIPATEKTTVNPEPALADLAIKNEGSRLTIGNRWYEYGIDLTQGFVIDRVINKWSPSTNIALSPSNGLRVRIGDTIYTGRCFSAAIERVTKDGAEIKLKSLRPELPLELHVTVTAGDTEELSFTVTAKNTGTQVISPEISLPALDGVSIGREVDTRVFFPQYRTVDTAEYIALRAPYGPEYAIQFMGLYNPKAGVGLMVRTDNPEQKMMDFALRKDEAGASGGVVFPAAYSELAPSTSKSYPKVSLFTHQGDWHRAFDLYTKWVRSWYKPVHAQDKPFFLNAWDIMCYRTSSEISWSDSRVPSVITPDRKQWLMDESLTFEKQRLGHVPDLVHFFNWTHNDKKSLNEYGVFGTPLAYEQVGGIEFFKQGINNIQTKWSTPVSLYTMHDRIRISSVPDKELVKELVDTSFYKELDANDQSNVVRASDTVDGIVFLQPGNDRWINFVISDLVKMQKDTGCKLVYIDVFPSFSHLRGYEGCSPREADLKVTTKLRNELPHDVAIWTEYPLTDVASQYADGCLQYYFMDVSQVFARRYNQPDTAPDLITEMPFNVQRFSTPTYRTFGLPTYIETGSKPSQVDATFFNGEAFQEDTYRLHHSRIRERLNRGYAIKKEYTDCFNSPNPEPRIYVPVGGIVSNLFPGDKRKLWTFFNGRPKTFSGVVLEIPHVEGAKYRDVWNGRDLVPEIKDGMARIVQRIDPQQMGCVVQDWSGEVSAVANKSEMSGEANH